MSLPRRLLSSLVGNKILMAATGLGLTAFLLAHMTGNLQIFRGREAFNDYAALLKSMPTLLWTARLGLLALFVVHVALAFRVSAVSKRAAAGPRPARPAGSTLASRHMLFSGIVVLAFVVYHLLHFTLGVVEPRLHDLVDSNGRHDVYSMVVLGFQSYWISASYALAMGLLALHLWHAIESSTRTLGVARAKWRRRARIVGRVTTLVLVVGFASVPFATLAGWLDAPEGVTR